MQYKGWNLEKTLLVPNEGEARSNELQDIRIPVDARYADNLKNDVRVVLKSDWNRITREIPSQAYQVQTEGPITTCRVAFAMDAPAHETQRLGIYYDNPEASSPDYPSPIHMNGDVFGGTLKTPFYSATFDEPSGQIAQLLLNVPLPQTGTKAALALQRIQEHASVLFAVKDGAGNVRPEYASDAQWKKPELVEDVRGPVFIKLVRRGKLAWPGCPKPEQCPSLEVGYRFFADQPFFLVHTRLTFVQDTNVFGVNLGGMSVEAGTYTHYTFRPVSPSLPNTDIEEMGHILIDPEYTDDLPYGSAFSNFIPYDIAWHAFIRSRKMLGRGVAMIQLHHKISDDFPHYRAGSYMLRQPEGFASYRSPVYVKTHRPENVVTVPAGAIVENLDAVALDAFDSNWGNRTDQLGKRLNNPLSINMHPRFMLGDIPPETWEPLPQGERSDAYRRYGVR